MAGLSALESQFGEAKARLRYLNARILADLIDTLSGVLEEAAFTVTKDGVRAAGMDPAKVAYIEVVIPYGNFAEYEVQEEGLVVGANLSSLSRVLSRTKKNDVVTFMVSPSQLLVKVEGGVPRTYLLPNLQVSSEAPEIRLEHTAHVKIISDAFRRALSDAGEFGDLVQLEATPDMFAVRAAGERRVEAKFLSGSASLVLLEVNEKAVGSYDFSYLDRVLALAKVADSVDVQFKTDSPLELRFESPGGLQVRYILAPSAGGAAPAEGRAEGKGGEEEGGGEGEEGPSEEE
ncbi:MAG: hypothetical protein ACP5HK_06425 [Acidilobus sp.]